MAFVVAIPAKAQSSFDQFKQQQNAKFAQFKENKQAEFDAFRMQVNEPYAELMKQKWEVKMVF